MIWALEFYCSTWPHYPHKLVGSGCKPEPAWCRVMFTLNSYNDSVKCRERLVLGFHSHSTRPA
ncbi:hypothetical protein KsCSTR_30440 [Candidatus Kuenenia stuttgartiensis]|uniref:Uncharacterized protein n=1 Tax=Kuenenia stuttgartiensis TaxID=174633 RepID=Q1Q5G0_KUEST|nr:hypothetical protein KsCSTR_30440 [Candidatus Kuenenia stuttgartiensis]CAJ75259.1 unknown protein [Candidatus Kuenenia stuttgartiensis]